MQFFFPDPPSPHLALPSVPSNEGQVWRSVGGMKMKGRARGDNRPVQERSDADMYALAFLSKNTYMLGHTCDCRLQTMRYNIVVTLLCVYIYIFFSTQLSDPVPSEHRLLGRLYPNTSQLLPVWIRCRQRGLYGETSSRTAGPRHMSSRSQSACCLRSLLFVLKMSINCSIN